MPHLRSSYCVYFLKETMECQTQHRPFVCVAKGRLWHGTSEVDWLCVLSKVYDDMLSPASSNCVCCPTAMIACHARRHPTVCSSRAMITCHTQRLLTLCAVQGRLLHATPDVVRLCVLSIGYSYILCPTSSDHVCSTREMMSFHTRDRLIVCTFQRRRCNARPNIIHLFVHPKGDYGMASPK